MILIISRRDDVHADLVIDELRREKESFFRLNTEVANQYDLSLTLSGGFIKNRSSGVSINLEDVTSVWLRRRSTPEINITPTHQQLFVEQEWVKFFRNIWVQLDGVNWVNNPLAVEVASNKLFQLKLAKQLGFKVPLSVIGNSFEGLEQVLKGGGAFIYKPHDGGAVGRNQGEGIYTNTLPEDFWESGGEIQGRLSLCPGIFQQMIPKAFELRVTVVGSEVFPAKIDSQASEKTRIDWRRYDFSKVKHEKFLLPVGVENTCVKLVKKLGLKFGAIDLVVTPDGQYYFLEINANGQWAWIQFLTGQDIAQALAIELSRKK